MLTHNFFHCLQTSMNVRSIMGFVMISVLTLKVVSCVSVLGEDSCLWTNRLVKVKRCYCMLATITDIAVMSA